jgi:hypothetical protein
MIHFGQRPQSIRKPASIQTISANSRVAGLPYARSMGYDAAGFARLGRSDSNRTGGLTHGSCEFGRNDGGGEEQE